MERPYDADESGTWHKDIDCGNFEGSMKADANLNGLHKAVANHGEGICPECFPPMRRAEILSMSGTVAEREG